MPHAEDQLMLRAQQGDMAAWDEVCKRHSKHLYNYLRTWELDHHDANDILQETFLRACRVLSKYEPGRWRNPYNWLRRIARFRMKVFFGEAYRERFLRRQLMGGISTYTIDGQYKVCSKCQRRLHTTMFYRKCTTSDGLQSQCKECQKFYQKERYALPEKKAYRKVQNRKWRLENVTRQREHEKNYHKRLREENRDMKGRDASGYIAGSAQAGAFWKGHDARGAGQPKESCPYGTKDSGFQRGFRRAWLLGWVSWEQKEGKKPKPKYEDQKKVCTECGYTFIWTARTQQAYWNAVKRGVRTTSPPTCGSPDCLAQRMRRSRLDNFPKITEGARAD